MITQNRIKTVLTLAAVSILALAIGQVQAKTITVPNGEFNMYKPGTNYTVRAFFPPGNYYVVGLGDNVLVMEGLLVDYADGGTGAYIDCPGWVTPIESQGSPTGLAQLYTWGYDPDSLQDSSCLNCFGAWSGQNGNLAESAESLGNLAASSDYTISAMLIGDAAPVTFELRAGGVALPPSSSVTPVAPANWALISRTYSAGDLAAYVGQPMTIVVGTSRPGEGDPPLTGQRGRFDNITLDVVINDPDLPDVDAGIDMISWSGQAVTMDPNVVNNDTQVPQRPLSYAWSAEPPDGVEFSNPAALAPTVTITKATDNPSVVTLTLAVTLPGKDPVIDTMTITVYDDACLAAIDLGLAVIDPTDLDENCITNFVDFALLATTWLDDYTLTEPAAKPLP